MVLVDLCVFKRYVTSDKSLTLIVPVCSRSTCQAQKHGVDTFLKKTTSCLTSP